MMNGALARDIHEKLKLKDFIKNANDCLFL